MPAGATPSLDAPLRSVSPKPIPWRKPYIFLDSTVSAFFAVSLLGAPPWNQGCMCGAIGRWCLVQCSFWQWPVSASSLLDYLCFGTWPPMSAMPAGGDRVLLPVSSHGGVSCHTAPSGHPCFSPDDRCFLNRLLLLSVLLFLQVTPLGWICDGLGPGFFHGVAGASGRARPAC